MCLVLKYRAIWWNKCNREQLRLHRRHFPTLVQGLLRLAENGAIFLMPITDVCECFNWPKSSRTTRKEIQRREGLDISKAIIFGSSFPNTFFGVRFHPGHFSNAIYFSSSMAVVSVPWNRGDPFEVQLVKSSGMNTGRRKGSTFLPTGSGNGLTGTGTMWNPQDGAFLVHDWT